MGGDSQRVPLTRADKLIDGWDEWFFTEFHHSAPYNFRFYSMQICFNWLRQVLTAPYTIVETGTIRSEKWEIGDGMSTLVFGSFCHYYGGRLFTVDINPEHLRRSREMTKQYERSIEYILSDSVAFLEKFKEPIDLLYLDSLDYEWDEDPQSQKHLPSQRHNSAELQAAYPNLHDQSIILIDDFFLPKGGKGVLSRDFLLNKGWIEVFKLQQGVYVKK